MNLSPFSNVFFLWGLFGFVSLYVFFGEALKSYLLQYRYRELKHDAIPDREKLTHLFSIVEDSRRFRRVFSNSLFVAAVAIAVACFTALLFSAVIGNKGFSEAAFFPQQIGFVLLLLVGFVVMGLCFKWIPQALGPRFPLWLLQLGTFYLVFVGGVLKPLRWGLLTGVGILKKLGLSEPEEPEPLDRDFQILAVGREDVKVTTITEKIASRALELNSISVYDVLLPRNQVQFFDLNESVPANLEIARKTGHTRFPLCHGDLDQCEGLIHIKDIFRSRKSVDSIDFLKLSRPILKVGQDEPLDKILHVLLTKRVHMALVEDEFGGILGVLTLERILEELVGEIQDEFDKEDKMIIPIKKDFYKILGMTPLHEVEDQLGVDDIEHEEVSSFGGLITHHLGRIPENGEQLEIGPLVITIKETDETRVISTMVRVLPVLEED